MKRKILLLTLILTLVLSLGVLCGFTSNANAVARSVTDTELDAMLNELDATYSVTCGLYAPIDGTPADEQFLSLPLDEIYVPSESSDANNRILQDIIFQAQDMMIDGKPVCGFYDVVARLYYPLDEAPLITDLAITSPAGNALVVLVSEPRYAAMPAPSYVNRYELLALAETNGTPSYYLYYSGDVVDGKTIGSEPLSPELTMVLNLMLNYGFGEMQFSKEVVGLYDVVGQRYFTFADQIDIETDLIRTEKGHIVLALVWAGDYNFNVGVTYKVEFAYNSSEADLISGSTFRTVRVGQAAKPPVLKRDGYALTWDRDFSYVHSDMTVNAVWTSTVSYTVTFNPAGGSLVNGNLTQTVGLGVAATAPTVKRDGYTFKGWDKSFNNITSDLTVNALWEINKYTVTFDLNGGTLTSGNLNQTINHGTVAALPTVEIVGGKFLGWFLPDGTQYTGQVITKNTTITARYEMYKYIITFIVDGKVYAYYECEHGTNLTVLLGAKNERN